MANLKISPDEYKKTLDHLELNDICLIESKMKLNEGYHSRGLDLKTKESSRFNLKDKLLDIIYTYKLLAQGKDKEKPFVEIIVKFKISYRIGADINIEKDFIDIFTNMTVAIILWPYFREFVQSIISRMNLPPLTLPMIKLI